MDLIRSLVSDAAIVVGLAIMGMMAILFGIGYLMKITIQK